MEVLRDSSIHGIISTIGGDDSIRMLPFLDLSVIRENPKVFVGYSDTTVTHLAFLKAGVTSYYGPSIMAGFDENGGLVPYTVDSVRQVLFGSFIPEAPISPNQDGWTSAPFAWAIKHGIRNRDHFNRARDGGGSKGLGGIAATWSGDVLKSWIGSEVLRSGPNSPSGGTA